ncbi:hypothetical protein [Salipiger abyssi]|uniref:hypothetical protein n=1 Tax=Salipiger abyssi TaxID=1250539 RepID=UPI001A8EBA88|nr:hypothetical protein [Salipiger abyssi]MBN9889230.1 hypothetical protein [Salipiger abyssi]
MLRAGLILAVAMAVAGPVLAQSKTEQCATSAGIVMTAVQARKDGESKAKARRALREALDRTAGDMLAEWIWELPEEQLTEEVGAAWEAQCLAQ